MRLLKIFATLTILLSLSSCLLNMHESDFDEEAISSKILVKVNLPEGYDNSVEGLKVTLTNPATGLMYTASTNVNGEAVVNVAHGTYIATTEKKESESGGIILIFNGTSESIRVSPSDPREVTAKIDLKVSKAGQIVIKEMYYGGCMNAATGKSYNKDQYIILYNNSGEVAYLDSLCIGVVYPYNAPSNGKVTDYVKSWLGTTELRDSLPNAAMGWIFPGTGKDNPLNPGEEAVISVNAINHAATISTSVDLGKRGYWALYDPLLTKGHSVPNAGVKVLNAYWKVGTSTAYSISYSCPAVFIYSMGGKSTTRFIADTYTWAPGNATNRNLDVLMIDKELVIDGVECLRSVTDSKRLRPEVDNGFAMIDGSGQGQSILRKVDAEATAAAGGRIVYMDTNNSSNDFEKRATPTLFGK